MPRKIPITKREREISERLRHIRIESGIPMTALAKKVGVNVNTLSSYEHARNPVPYFVASRIARATNTCERWLATGKLPKNPFFGVNERVEDELFPARILFSEIYKKVLSGEFESRLALAAERCGCKTSELTTSHFVRTLPLFSTFADLERVLLKIELSRADILGAELPAPMLQDYNREFHLLNERYIRLHNVPKNIYIEHQSEESAVQNVLEQVRKLLEK